MFLGNFSGLIFFVIALGLASEFVSPQWSTAVGGLILVLIDLLYRGVRGKGDRSYFLSPGQGGVMLFLPIWGWGVFWIILGLVRQSP